MSTSSDLFVLVKSLTAAEKRYFKKKAKTGKKAKHNYILLFDAVEKQKEYNEDKLIKKFTETNLLKDYSPQKTYLINQILQAMALQNKENIYLNNKLELHLFNAHFLFKKGLFQRSAKEIRTKILVHKPEYETASLFLDACQLYRSIVHRFESKAKKKILDDIQFLENRIIQSQEITIKLFRVYDILLSSYNKDALAIKDQSDSRKSVLNQLDFIKEEQCVTITSRYYYYICQSLSCMVRKDLISYHNYYQKLLDLYDEYPKKKKEETHIYITICGNFLSSCLLVEAYQKMELVLNMLESIKAPNYTTEVRLFQNIINYRFIYYLNSQQLNKGINTLLHFEEFLPNYINDIPKKSLITIYHHAILVLFYAEKYTKIIEWANKIIDAGKYSPRQDLQDAARLFSIIAYFEMDEHDFLVSYHIRNVQNYFREHNRNDTVAQILIKTLKKIINSPLDKKLRASIWEDGFTEIKSIENKSLHPILEITTWFASKVYEKPLADLMDTDFG